MMKRMLFSIALFLSSIITAQTSIMEITLTIKEEASTRIVYKKFNISEHNDGDVFSYEESGVSFEVTIVKWFESNALAKGLIYVDKEGNKELLLKPGLIVEYEKPAYITISQTNNGNLQKSLDFKILITNY